MGKVPTTKLDLAHSRAFTSLHPATPARRKHSGGRGVKGRRGELQRGGVEGSRGVIMAGKLRDGRAG